MTRQPPAIRVVSEPLENPIEADEKRPLSNLAPDQNQLSLIASDSRLLLDYVTGFGNRSKQDAESSVDRLLDSVGGSSWPWKGWPLQDSNQLQPALLAVSGLVKTLKDPRWNQAVPKEVWAPVVGALNIIDHFAASGPSGLQNSLGATQAIESADACNIVDSTSAGLIREIQHRLNTPRFHLWAGALGLAVAPLGATQQMQWLVIVGAVLTLIGFVAGFFLCRSKITTEIHCNLDACHSQLAKRDQCFHHQIDR